MISWVKSTGALIPTQPNPQYSDTAAPAAGKKGGRKNKKAP